MMDKDTGRPRGFGFVTFDGDAAVDACLEGNLQILGKPIEVKRAQPRGNMREEEDNKKFGRNKFGSRDNNSNNNGGGYDGGQNNANQQQQQQGGANSSMTPAMMAQYWQRMQQYFQQMQSNIATGAVANPMGAIGPMNPTMMMLGGMSPGGGPGAPMGGPGMNPMMAAQFAQMQGGGGGGYGGDPNMMGGNGGARPNLFNPQDQLAFEQQKYEQQQQRRIQQSSGYGGGGGPTSWEGMYDDTPQPSIPAGPGGHRGPGSYGGPGKQNRGRQGSSQPPAVAPNAPANAPTGPKNAGKPGANYRGGGRATTYRHNPYSAGRGN
jgi:RNA-binding protein Musashi